MAKSKKREIKGKESWRDLSITRTCATCKRKYHPRRNSYQLISIYCSRPCAAKGRKKLFSAKNKIQIYEDGFDISDIRHF